VDESSHQIGLLHKPFNLILMKKLYAVLLAVFSFLQFNAQFVASSEATGTSTEVTIPKPIGVVQDDLMIAAIHTGWCQAGSSLTAPVGWTLIAETGNTGSGCGESNTSILLATFYKIAGASEPADYTFEGSTTQIYVGGIVAYSDININSPLIASSTNSAQEECSDIVASGVTTTSACTRLVSVFFCSVNYSGNNIIPDASLTERLDAGTTGNNPWGNENVEISDQVITTTGPTGDKHAMLENCIGSGWVTGGQLIALQCVPSINIEQYNSSSDFNVMIYPISSGIFEAVLKDNILNNASLEVYDAMGKMMSAAMIKDRNTRIDLSAESKGVYFVKIHSLRGMVCRKIVVQ
jgi:hypothetical protein